MNLIHRSDADLLRLIRFAAEETLNGEITHNQMLMFVFGLVHDKEPIKPIGWGELKAKSKNVTDSKDDEVSNSERTPEPKNK